MSKELQESLKRLVESNDRRKDKKEVRKRLEKTVREVAEKLDKK